MALIGSRKLEEAISDYESKCDADYGECADMTSTSGYDNDGSIGPELIENGVELGFACRDYDPKAQVFCAGDNGNTTYYVYGLTEEDAVSRFRKRADAEVARLTESDG